MPGEIGFLITVLEALAALFIFVIGSVALWLVVLYVTDVSQTRQAIRRNYPVLGRFRYLFERLGKFFRQYFFALDREEMPFNRAQRSWIYQAAKGTDTTVAFGSTRDLRPAGSLLFANCPFPTLHEDAAEPAALTIGPYCRTPYTTASLFNVSAMSYGAISRPAVQALSHGARMGGAWLNTGEGGLSPYHLEGHCDLVFQIGTAKYGVRDAGGRLDDERLRDLAGHTAVRMFEIKLSQGAKPGKGGILPGRKITDEIAAIRGIPPGLDSVSPNRFPEIDSVEGLLSMVEHVRAVTGKPVGCKFVLGASGWLDEMLAAVHERGIASAPDFLTVDSAEGGTGAAPMSLIDHVGLPIQESLPLVVDRLKAAGLRERVKVIATGKLVNPADVAWAVCMGADFVASARGFMFALGCIQALQCNRNTCPTGITTHDPRLQRGLVPQDKAERIASYIRNMEHEVGVIAHACGVREPRELRRSHARVVGPDGLSRSLADLHPDPPAPARRTPRSGPREHLPH